MSARLSVVLLLAIIGLLGWHFADRAKLQANISAITSAKAAAELSAAAATTEAAAAKAANTANLAAVQRLKKAMAEAQALTRAEEERRAAIQARYDTLNTRYLKVIQNDQQTRDWASIPIPDAVRSLFDDPAEAGADSHHGDAGGAGVPAEGPALHQDGGKA